MRFCALVIVVLAGCGNAGNSSSCAEPQQLCGSACVDLAGSHDNCGACGTVCGAAEVCSASTCTSSCAANETACSGTCADLTTDPSNCGGCGMACDAGDVCVDSTCQIPCNANDLTAKVTDPWGIQWDGANRTAATFDAAKTACSAFGARLPTATELFRVSSTESGSVGKSTDTTPTWTLVPVDKTNQVTMKLSDGSVGSTALTAAVAYRCVCPAALPRTFTGKHCNGNVGSECFTLGAENIDAKDRPALRRSSQLWECTNDRAHLVESNTLIEALRSGLPGSGQDVATADSADYQSEVTIAWTTAASFTGHGNLGLTSLQNFRCAAPKAALVPNPNVVPNQFAGPMSANKSETADSTPASWTTAHDTCVVRGGHLPRAAELAELIQQGLPNGSNASLWTSDQAGYNAGTTSFYAAVLNWTAVDQRFSFQYTGNAQTTATWLAKQTASAPFRCIYYPLDKTYVAPTTCNGGCFIVTANGTPAPTMWFDSTDRAMATLSDASLACATLGAHLASERDLTEAIRAGLPNGSGTYIYTSDLTWTPNATIVQWPQSGTGTDTAFNDQYNGAASSYMTWSALNASRPYRCMWTNEQR